jgi:serine phosphatase RsbU (regulator of sigma subunit)
MTYRIARNIVEIGATAVAAFAFLIVPFVAAAGMTFLPALAVGAVSFLALYILKDAATRALDRHAYKLSFRGRETRLLSAFSERVGVSFTIPDLVDAIRDKLEKAADMGAILIRSATWETVYQSPSSAASDPSLLEALSSRFKDSGEALVFLSDELEAIPAAALGRVKSRGFLVRSGGYHLFVLTRLCSFIEPEAFRVLQSELSSYFERVPTVSELFEVASLSKEWQLIAETQRSFLPRELPKPRKLDLAVFYRPLVNVSGDYYDAIAIDENRTLLVVGDVSGKGLAAALVMGIIVNTIRVAADKENLVALVRTVDAAVRDMGFDDKYTVMFLGLVDTDKKTLRYVNAAMADPIIISQTATGPRMVRLDPTTSIVGLVPIDEVVVEELPLRTDEIILLASDGVTEVPNASGARLGETDFFERSLALASKSGASDFVGSVSAMLYSYVGDQSLKDDVTILAAKVGRLWD